MATLLTVVEVFLAVLAGVGFIAFVTAVEVILQRDWYVSDREVPFTLFVLFHLGLWRLKALPPVTEEQVKGLPRTHIEKLGVTAGRNGRVLFTHWYYRVSYPSGERQEYIGVTDRAGAVVDIYTFPDCIPAAPLLGTLDVDILWVDFTLAYQSYTGPGEVPIVDVPWGNGPTEATVAAWRGQAMADVAALVKRGGGEDAPQG